MDIKTNKYYQHRKEIWDLCMARGVTASVGTSMFEAEKGWPSGTGERHIWDAYLIGFQRARKDAPGMDKNGDGIVNLADAFV